MKKKENYFNNKNIKIIKLKLIFKIKGLEKISWYCIQKILKSDRIEK